MPRTYTSGELEIRIRTEAGLTGSTAVTQAEILALIDVYYAELYDLLVEAHGHAHYAASHAFSTVANQTDYTIPEAGGHMADIYLLLGVDLDTGGGEVVALDPVDFHHRNLGKTAQPWRTKTAYPRYRWHGGNLKLIPAPDAVYTVTVHYVPVCAKVISDAIIIDGVNGWERYIVASVLATLCAAEETDPSVYLAEKAALKGRIEGLAKQRVADGPEQIVRRRRRGSARYYNDDE